MESNKEVSEHDCEFFLTTDVCVHSCECEHVTVSDNSISIEYVPLKKYQSLKSETTSLREENERLREALKTASMEGKLDAYRSLIGQIDNETDAMLERKIDKIESALQK
jgi:hypothetical protein